ncbi:transposable element Tcb2 transposase [Trichonephila clavipes]|nr:transposable element Tcb2 transposase [Trichonephila clavipes]
MVWGVIAYNTRSPLVLIRGTMTSFNHMCCHSARLPGAIFRQDNALPHTARVSQDFLRTVTILPWSARSPYLSPIEPIWDNLGQQVGHPMSLKN